MNNKGFLKTLEAVVAIMLLFTFIYIILPKTVEHPGTTPENVKSIESFVVKEMLYNNSFRDCVFTANNDYCPNQGSCDIQGFIANRLPYGYQYTCEICDRVQTCIPAETIPFDRNIYVDSVYFIEDKPKVMRIYFWEKE